MIIGREVKRSQVTPSARAVRRLHRGHFAFMRALIHGMDERAAWARYLHEEGEATDVRRIRSTVLWIKDTFAAAARRERRPGTARLIRLDAERIAQRSPPKLPSLEDFALAQGLEGFSEDEQLEAYLAAFPEASTAGTASSVGQGMGSRRARVLARQLEALRWLEELVVHDPNPLDAVEAWLSPAMAARLRGAGLLTLQDLAQALNASGPRWWRRVPGIGRHKAARLAEWLQVQAPMLRIELTEYALTPRAQLSAAVRQSVVATGTALRPLEKFISPDHVDGRQGRNRYPGLCRLSGVGTDVDAVQAWIRAKGVGGHESGSEALSATQRSYRKEGERLLLWCVLVREKALSDIEESDVIDYLHFLKAPAAHWCGPRSHPRWSPLWRPLEGPLSDAALRQARVIVHGLLGFLVEHRYLSVHPCPAPQRRRSQVENFQ